MEKKEDVFDIYLRQSGLLKWHGESVPDEGENFDNDDDDDDDYDFDDENLPEEEPPEDSSPEAGSDQSGLPADDSLFRESFPDDRIRQYNVLPNSEGLDL